MYHGKQQLYAFPAVAHFFCRDHGAMSELSQRVSINRYTCERDDGGEKDDFNTISKFLVEVVPSKCHAGAINSFPGVCSSRFGTVNHQLFHGAESGLGR